MAGTEFPEGEILRAESLNCVQDFLIRDVGKSFAADSMRGLASCSGNSPDRHILGRGQEWHVPHAGIAWPLAEFGGTVMGDVIANAE
jgi:hypothetical protein